MLFFRFIKDGPFRPTPWMRLLSAKDRRFAGASFDGQRWGSALSGRKLWQAPGEACGCKRSRFEEMPTGDVGMSFHIMPPSRLTNARGPFSVEFIKMTGNRFKAVPEIYTRSTSLS